MFGIRKCLHKDYNLAHGNLISYIPFLSKCNQHEQYFSYFTHHACDTLLSRFSSRHKTRDAFHPPIHYTELQNTTAIVHF